MMTRSDQSPAEFVKPQAMSPLVPTAICGPPGSVTPESVRD